MPLNDVLVRTLVGTVNFEKGMAYYQHGAVQNARQRGYQLLADVEGSQPKPYPVQLTLVQGGISAMRCTCPFVASAGNYCKHIAAVLITYVQAPATFVRQPEPADLLKDLPREQLQTLWQTLLTQRPDMADWLESALTGLTAKASAPSKRHSTVDVKTYRRQVASILRGADPSRPYQTIWGITEQLHDVENQARAFLESGDARNALAILTVIAEEVIPQYEMLEDETQLSDYFYIWSKTMAEAILLAELSAEEKETLKERVDDWVSGLGDYGSDEALALVQTALDDSDQDEKSGWNQDDLTELKLKIAERTQDAETYLSMCLQANAHLRYAQKLASLGRITAAHSYALRHLTRADEAFTLAQAFQASGASEQAYEMDVHGLSLEGSKYELGKWLAIYTESIGKPEIALKGWLAAFTERGELDLYQHIHRLADTEWTDLQPKLMGKLEAIAVRGDIRSLVGVLLVEGDVDRAISTWDNSHWKDRTLLSQLLDAAAAAHPDWAIRESLAQANALIDRGSGHYAEAASWLKRLKAIYVQHGRLGPDYSDVFLVLTSPPRPLSVNREGENLPVWKSLAACGEGFRVRFVNRAYE